MNSKQILLDKFRENQSNRINATDLRQFVEAIYNEALLLENVLDRSDIFTDDQVASIKQVSEIKDKLEGVIKIIENIETDFARNSEVYKTSEVDAIFMGKKEAYDRFYKKEEVANLSELSAGYYTKQELDNLFAQVDSRLSFLEKAGRP